MCAQSTYPSESVHLLASVRPYTPAAQKKSSCVCYPLKYLCLPSKATILILMWTTIVGMMYHSFMALSAYVVFNIPKSKPILATYDPLPYAVLAIVMIFYPLGGFVADVCCGRLKTVAVSLILLLICCNIITLLAIGVTVLETVEIIADQNIYTSLHDQGILANFLVALSFLVFVVGLTGYQANFIQLGLDQLFEAPSNNLGLFIHYAVWAFKCIGSLVFIIVLILYCIPIRQTAVELVICMLVACVLIFVLLLLVSCWKRKWFHSEPGQTNPYKTVYKIIKYAKTHKYPLRRSAFTHCDNYIPSRLDFAKERYGGPFTTENVKTLLRILLVLFAIGPVFSMEVVASVFIFPLTSVHVLHGDINNDPFTNDTIWKLFVGTGNLKNTLTMLILFPAYIWIIFSLLHKKVPKLFTRLGVGIVTCLLGIFSLLIIDVVGHSMNRENVTNHSMCMFRATLTNTKSLNYPTLNMHWSVLIPPKSPSWSRSSDSGCYNL